MENIHKLSQAIVREPYRLFFPLGIAAGSLGIVHWLLYAKGIIATYSGFFHSSILTMVYLNCFIGGFLMTAFPRFTQTQTAKALEVIALTAIFGGITVSLFAQQWVIAELLLIGFYAFTLWFILSRVINRGPSASRGKPPIELIWLPIAFMHGFTATVLLILGQLEVLDVWSLKVAKPMLDQGFSICLVAGIGGFLIPRLMGTFDNTTDNTLSKVKYYIVCALLVFVSFFVEGFLDPAIAYGLRAAAVTAAFLKSNILTKLPQDKGLYAWMAWASVWMVVLGLWGASLLNNYQTLMLHVTFIGGFSLMIFAVASMVIMSHSGEGERLNGHLWVLWVVLVGVTLSLIVRFMVVPFPDSYFQLLGMSSSIWIVSSWIWLGYMLPRLFKVPDEDEFEKLHEAAKARLKGN